jgi:acyl carrier protein
MPTREAYLTQLAELILSLFDEFEGRITEETTARDVPQWDSLSHVKLMVLVEQEFNVRFSTAEVQGFKNLGSLIDALVTRKG